MTQHCDNTPILITGCPRSGTTWVGTTVGESSQVLYLYEPFNNDAPHQFGLQQRFVHVEPNAAPDRVAQMPDVMRLCRLDERVRKLGRATMLGANFRSELAVHLTAHELRRHPRKFWSANRICIKDPLAFFAAEWLAEQHRAQVVVLMRHPAGVISSYLKLGWSSEAGSLLEQPELRRRFLGGCEDDIARLSKDPTDVIGMLILQWKLFATAALQLHAAHPDWIFVTHESICRRPVEHFKSLYDRLGLPFEQRIETNVRASSAANNQADPKHHQQHMLKRDSKAVSEAWKQRLDDDARRRIDEETHDDWQKMQALSWTA